MVRGERPQLIGICFLEVLDAGTIAFGAGFICVTLHQGGGRVPNI